ncbi:MAG TPA: hypothetical protein VIG25_18765, partial [Pyrinomonadaceae bacterium]
GGSTSSNGGLTIREYILCNCVFKTFIEIGVGFVGFASKVDFGGNEFVFSSCEFVDRSFCPEN